MKISVCRGRTRCTEIFVGWRMLFGTTLDELAKLAKLAEPAEPAELAEVSLP